MPKRTGNEDEYAVIENPTVDPDGNGQAGANANNNAVKQDALPSKGKQSLLSRLTHGAIDGTERKAKSLGKELKNYLMHPFQALRGAASTGVTRVATGLNVSKTAARIGLASLGLGGGIGALFATPWLTTTHKSDMVEVRDEYINPCMINYEDIKPASAGEKSDDYQQHNIEVMYDLFFNELGYSREMTVAIMSTWMPESHCDPRVLESYYMSALSQPAQDCYDAIGTGMPEGFSEYTPTTAPADGSTSLDAYMEYNHIYTSTPGTILNDGYLCSFDGEGTWANLTGEYGCGVGLAQWTADRGCRLMAYVDKIQQDHEYSAFDLSYQLAFAVYEFKAKFPDLMDPEDGTWSNYTNNEDATKAFASRFEGCPDDQLDKRVGYNSFIDDSITRAEFNDQFTGEITDMAELLAEAEISGNKLIEDQIALCMTSYTFEPKTIVEAAYSVAWVAPLDAKDVNAASGFVSPDGTYSQILKGQFNSRQNYPFYNRDPAAFGYQNAPFIINAPLYRAAGDSQDRPVKMACTQYYLIAHNLVAYPTVQKALGGNDEDPYFASCDRSTAVPIRMAGADDRFPLGDPQLQTDYILDGNHRYGAENDLWDCAGIINQGFYYPYSASLTMSPGYIVISRGTTQDNDPTMYFGPRCSNDTRFISLTNATGDHIMIYSGYKGLQDRYGDTLFDQWLANRDNPEKGNYDNLLKSDITLNGTLYMTDGLGNHRDCASDATDRDETFYTAETEILNSVSSNNVNAKTGLVEFRSYEEIRQALQNQLDKLYVNKQQEYSDQWPSYKIDLYAALLYRNQQMLRFGLTTQFCSIASEEDANIIMNSQTSDPNANAYCYMNRFVSEYEGILCWPEAIYTAYRDAHYNYSGRLFAYQDMISNDMFQDLMQLYSINNIVRNPGSTSKIPSGVSSADVYKDGDFGFIYGYGLGYGFSARDISQYILKSFNETMDIDQFAINFQRWYDINVGLRGRGDTIEAEDFKDPYNTGRLTLNYNYINIESMGILDAQNASKWLELHYLPNTDDAATAEFLIPRLYMVFGNPDEIEFTNEYSNEDNGISIIDTKTYTLNILPANLSGDDSVNTVNVANYIQHTGDIIDLSQDSYFDSDGGPEIGDDDGNLPTGNYLFAFYHDFDECEHHEEDEHDNSENPSEVTGSHTVCSECDDDFGLRVNATALIQDLEARGLSSTNLRIIISTGSVTKTYTLDELETNDAVQTEVLNMLYEWGYEECPKKCDCCKKHVANVKTRSGVKIYFQYDINGDPEEIPEDMTQDELDAKVALPKIIPIAYTSDGKIADAVMNDDWDESEQAYIASESGESYRIFNIEMQEYKPESEYDNDTDKGVGRAFEDIEKVYIKAARDGSQPYQIFGQYTTLNSSFYDNSTYAYDVTQLATGTGFYPQTSAQDGTVIQAIIGVNTYEYAVNQDAEYPQHILFSGLGGSLSGYGGYAYTASKDGTRLVTDHGPSNESGNDVQYSTFYNKDIEDGDDVINDYLKTLGCDGQWMIDGSIGNNGPHAAYQHMGQYMQSFTYGVYFNTPQKDEADVDGDGDTDEPFIYEVVADDTDWTYYYKVNADDPILSGTGENSFYKRLIDIWNEYEVMDTSH